MFDTTRDAIPVLSLFDCNGRFSDDIGEALSKTDFETQLASLDKRIAKFSVAHELELTCDFSPASEEAVAKCEAAIGVSFPKELRQLFTLFSDGGREADVWKGFFGGDQFNSLSDMIAAHEDHVTSPEYQSDEQGWWSDTPQVKQGQLWRKEWIVIGAGYDLRYFYLDTDPAPKGNLGQILIAEHTSCRYGVVAKNLPDFIELCLTHASNSNFRSLSAS